MSNMPPKVFESTLEWMTISYTRHEDKVEIDSILDALINHVLSYLHMNKQVFKNPNDLAGFLTHMKGVYTSSRTKDPTILDLRDRLEKLVFKATKVRTPNVLSSVRTGVWIYIILRVFTMSHYTNQ